MTDLTTEIERIAEETRFSGVVHVARDDEDIRRAYGLADRANGIPNTVETRLAIASGTKGFTALAVMSLVEEGKLELVTPARTILGEDLPLIDDAVTIEQLLTHRSGIGDYFDEEIDRPMTDHILEMPTHRLGSVEAHVEALDGFPTKDAPGERFLSNNAAFVVLAIVAERVSGTPYHDLVRERVTEPAGMTRTGFVRSDAPEPGVAVGYLEDDGLRTNVLHMPLLGGGDGGAVSTIDDLATFWRALFEGRIVSRETAAEMTRAHTDGGGKDNRYGLGFWIHATRDVVELHGYDAGISFWSDHDPASGEVLTVISNTTEGTWALLERLDPMLGR